MQIHVVSPGETLQAIARQYNQAPGLIARFNALTAPYTLAVGQALVILDITRTYQVQAGDTLDGLASANGLSPVQLLQRNPNLAGQTALYPGQTLVLELGETPLREIQVSGYAYPYVNPAVLRGILPYATYLIPFTYGIRLDGSLVELRDEPLIALAREYGALPLMHLSTLTENDSFSTSRAELVFQNPALAARLRQQVVEQIQQRGYEGLDIDFEFLGADNAQDYVNFVAQMRAAVNALGYELIVALAPKTYAGQPGLLYQGHSYPDLAAAADGVLLMTYEWGYTYGPPMAVAPLPSVRRVLDYAVTEMPPDKILMGFPNYGYDWTLPFRPGSTRADSISNEYAVQLAVRYRAEIQFDETARTPYFNYLDASGAAHEVWFEDARSAQAKLELVAEYGFRGIGVWNFMRPFVQGWAVLQSLYTVAKLPSALG